jgi:hypothetical protein
VAVVLATGGVVTVVGGYRIHTFTGSGTFAVTNPGTVQVLVVAGGGGGGSGGGGGGGVIYSNAYPVIVSNYTVTVGAGGTAGNGNHYVSPSNPNGAVAGGNGGDSVWGSLKAFGGGGGNMTDVATGIGGGSGGGGGAWGSGTTSGGSATNGQGNSGGGNGGYSGSYPTSGFPAGGGGGAGAQGGTATSSSVAGNGGDGIASAISCVTNYYGGGGGGGYFCHGTLTSGGKGGGGRGGDGPDAPGVNGEAGDANTGGGGGGSGEEHVGGTGGSGIVIVRYFSRIATATALASSANPSVYGQSSVTFTATVTGAGGGPPTGTVQFKTNGVNFGSAVTLSGGSATSGALPTTFRPGTCTVTADYSGDTSFMPCAGTLAGGQTVNPKALTVTATGPLKTYGTALSVGTSTTNFTHSGEVPDEAVTSVTLTPDAAGLSAATPAGTAYVVTPSLATGSGGFLAANYNITYNPYNGTVALADFRSVTSGDWNIAATWQRDDGSDWVAASSSPSNTDGTITILNAHTVTVTQAVSVDQVVVAAGGQVTVNSGVTWTVLGDAGVNLMLAGRLLVNGSVAASPLVVGNGAVLGGTNTITGNVTAQSGGIVAPGASIGTLTVTNGNVTLESNSTFRVEYGISPDCDKLDLSKSGALVLEGATLDLVGEGLSGDRYTIVRNATNIVGTFKDLTNCAPVPGNAGYFIHYVTDRTELGYGSYILINKNPSPTSSGIDLRAYQGADGVYVEFVAYDVEDGSGTVRLAVLGADGKEVWSGETNVLAGARYVCRFLVPGLAVGGTYNFVVRDEVGKGWSASGVTVTPFAAKMVSLSLTGVTLSFDSLPEREYEIQWVARLGDVWQTVATVTADSDRTRAFVTYPDPKAPSGFFRVRVK